MVIAPVKTDMSWSARMGVAQFSSSGLTALGWQSRPSNLAWVPCRQVLNTLGNVDRLSIASGRRRFLLDHVDGGVFCIGSCRHRGGHSVTLPHRGGHSVTLPNQGWAFF